LGISPFFPAKISTHSHLFRLWSPLDWTSSDDRVRGGSSISKLTCSPFSPIAEFHGTLDIKTLGGAGFASHRTTGEDRKWDLSKYDGLVLDVVKSDGKKYTLILKDELLEKSPDGREQATVSWEYDFPIEDGDAEEGGKGKVFVKWEDLKPTYRGRDKKDAKPLDLENIERISLMIRRYVCVACDVPQTKHMQHADPLSFFGTQEGDFSLSIKSISAANKSESDHDSDPQDFTKRYRDDPNEKEIPRITDDKSHLTSGSLTPPQGWISYLLGRLC